MERTATDPLHCPRCNSSNTKFCYYNNYNLSQPRHFCKACKRYWTRGGTLRNIPVGGGCRKNKKFKRHPTSNGGGAASTLLSPPSSSNPSPLLSAFPTELKFPFSATRVSSDSHRFDDLPRISGPRLGFLPLIDGNIQDHGDSSCTPTMAASLLAQHQRFAEFSSLMPYEDVEMVVGNGGIGEESRMFEGEIVSNQIEQIQTYSSSSFLWNCNNFGAWFDSSSSVPSLI